MDTPANPLGSSHFDLERELLNRLEAGRVRVPPYSAVAQRLKRLALDPHVTAQKLASVIQTDAALVGAVLSQANSPAYGRGYVVGIDGAIARIGLEAVIRLSVTLTLAAAADAPGRLRHLRRDAWRRSLLAGKFASTLAAARSLDREEAFVAGLLQGFGATTVLAALEDLGVTDEEAALAVVERLQVQFGCEIAARWNVPEPVRLVIEHCMDAAPYVGPNSEVVRAVAASLAVIAALDRAPADGLTAIREVGDLTTREADRIKASLAEVTELMNAFEPRVEVARPVAPERRQDDLAWPIDINATAKGMTLRAYAMETDMLLLVAPQPLPQNWLVPLVLHSEPPIDMLANIIYCRARGDGTHALVVRPFGLDGAHQQAWRQLVHRVRPA